MDGLDTPLEVDTKIANALLGLATEAFVAAQLASRDQDTATASSIAAALLSYYTAAQVDGLLAGKLGVTEAASALQIAVRFPDDGGADEVVAAIGEQILAPTDVSLSNWTVRPSSGCSVVLATHTAGVNVDGYTLTLAANPWNIVRTYNLTPGRELLFAAGTGSARPPTSWCTCPRPTTSTTHCTAASRETRAFGARPRCTSPCHQTGWRSSQRRRVVFSQSQRPPPETSETSETSETNKKNGHLALFSDSSVWSHFVSLVSIVSISQQD